MKQILFFLWGIAPFVFAIPMESLDDYNVYLIHGTGSRWGGLDCENGDKKGNVYIHQLMAI
jgi:hypothetical protein